MSRGAFLSIMGLYNNDNTVFDLMVFPEDFTEAQKQNVIESIIYECAELEVLYPNPTVMKNVIGIWSNKELPYWDRMYKASLLEYNPIENYRRNEVENISDDKTEEHSGNDTNRASGSDALAKTGTEANSGSSSSTEMNSGTDTENNNITGFDSNTLVAHDQRQTIHGHTVGNQATGSNTTTHNTTDTTTYGRTDTYTHGEKIEHEGSTARSLLAYGNIGTMTSQDMLTQETEVAKIVQVVPIIIESFKDRFCIMVY